MKNTAEQQRQKLETIRRLYSPNGEWEWEWDLILFYLMLSKELDLFLEFIFLFESRKS